MGEDTLALTPKAVARLQAATEKASRHFRSDVVTVPTQAMVQSIIEATFGDDTYDTEGDPSVSALENKIAELTGKEAALWTMSGTQGNQICLRVHLTQPPHSVLVDARSHIQSNGVYLTLEDVQRNMIPEGNIHHAETRVVCLENTLAGTILPLEEAKKISEFVRSYSVPAGTNPVVMHPDGARIFDAAAAEGGSLKECTACFDSVSICLAKGLGAPMGSIIAGTKAFIERARYFKKMFGGAIRQSGMMAAAALAAMKITLPKLKTIHSLTYNISTKLEALGYKLALPAQTNMIALDLAAMEIPGSTFVEY
ncbi:unnamed protein product [Clonostachys rhizophaga]|uniref:Aromatic amino acid beta-eliminating lyase/threonine aldolase domain-containing protein n=1 Tax=Clonostachys rhizophaga TaxID=160324 RepID=A0A9N9VCB3_9HYPO|nr:unnamed protein product [Clonostachys rhizophaga]